jgi:hypothetical protein
MPLSCWNAATWNTLVAYFVQLHYGYSSVSDTKGPLIPLTASPTVMLIKVYQFFINVCIYTLHIYWTEYISYTLYCIYIVDSYEYCQKQLYAVKTFSVHRRITYYMADNRPWKVKCSAALKCLSPTITYTAIFLAPTMLKLFILSIVLSKIKKLWKFLMRNISKPLILHIWRFSS